MKSQLVNVNGSGSGYVSLTPPILCRRVTVVEDASVTPQGLTWQQIDDGYTATYTVGVPASPDEPQIDYVHPSMQGSGAAIVVGAPEQNLANGTSAFNYQAAIVPLKVRSKTATTTKVLVTFYE